jgi:signal recognition particle subunit SRP54
MTKRERREPVIIDGSRRTRIARGSGTTVSAVNQLLKQFNEMRKMMRQMSGGAMPAMPGGMGRMANMAAKAQRGEALPPGFEALGAGMKSAQPVRSGGGKNKKKKGGRVTPPKQR